LSKSKSALPPACSIDDPTQASPISCGVGLVEGPNNGDRRNDWDTAHGEVKCENRCVQALAFFGIRDQTSMLKNA
jgi:hypothetical protein